MAEFYDRIYHAMKKCQEKSLRVKVRGKRRSCFRYDEDDCDLLEFLDITPEEYLALSKPTIRDGGYGTSSVLDRLIKFASAKIRAEVRLEEGCPYLMKTGKNKGKPCGKLNCSKHSKKEESEEEDEEDEK